MSRYFVLLYVVSTVCCRCPIGFETLDNGDCYRTFTAPSLQRDAESSCEREGATLVQPLNAFVDAQIQDEANFFNVNLWLGLTCLSTTSTSCTYSDGNSVTTSSYTNFYPGFPNPDIGNCVFLSISGPQTGKWVSGNCTEQTIGFGCQVTAKSMVHNFVPKCGSSYQELNDFCYKTIPSTTENRAESVCEMECGHLTSIHSQQENDFVLSLALQTENIKVRIGLEYTNNRDYEWLDGSVSPLGNYSNFGRKDSNVSDCVAMSLMDGDVAKGEWMNAGCSDSLPSVCKRPKSTPCASFVQPSISPFTPPPSTSTVSTTKGTTPAPTDAPPNCPSPFSFRKNDTGFKSYLVFSPGYPNLYASGLECEYHIYARTGDVVSIYLSGVDTFEDDASTISLYNSITDTVPFLSRLRYGFGWHDLTQFYASTTSTMKVKFSSGSSNTYRWVLDWDSLYFADSGCNQGVLHTPGSITSPNYYQNNGYFYPSSYYCEYKLEAPFGKRVAISSHYFYTADVGDLVSIYDGRDSNSDLLGNYWGNRQDRGFAHLSSTKYMFVTFKTDETFSHYGFELNFEAVDF